MVPIWPCQRYIFAGPQAGAMLRFGPYRCQRARRPFYRRYRRPEQRSRMPAPAYIAKQLEGTSQHLPQSSSSTIGFIGGTGPEGRGLAVRFAAAGHDVQIGSRDATRATEAADEVKNILAEVSDAADVRGALNADAAAASDIVFIAVPYAGMMASLEQLSSALSGKICVNVIAPLSFAGGIPAAAPPEIGSAAEQAAQYAPDLRWVAGLHTLSARDLLKPTTSLDTDAIICGDDDDAKTTVSDLLSEVPGLRSVDAGPLQSARYLEGATALLININKRYKSHASVTISGLNIG
jgi:NADPH-dependent F420 reductase